MTRIVDKMASIELGPEEPTREQVEKVFSADVADVLATQDSEDYNELIAKIKILSAETKIKILSLPLSPTDPVYGGKIFGAILRAQTALAQGTENNVVKTDEAVMRKAVADELLPDLLESLRREGQRLRELPFRRTLD